MDKVNISRKKILYIGNLWFHYDQCLVDKLKQLGGSVDCFELDLTGPCYYITRKLGLHKAESYKTSYYNRILLKNGYDYVLIRHGYQLEPAVVRQLRLANPDARFIGFHWDSLRPEYNYLPIIEYFDKVVSFDYKDCRDHSGINYLPLFYIDDYGNIEDNKQASRKIDVLFIGAWRDRERYDLVKITASICKRLGLRFYYYLYSPLIEQFYSIKNHGVIQKEAKTRKLSHKEIIELFSVTRAVIDFQNTFQTGLTMRCFETLAAGLKLITTNRNIINEPFFDKEFIYITDKKNLRLDYDFIKSTPKTTIRESIREYSLENYVYKLLA
ncbi:MAG: hypothetical protein Q8868_08610 [Bacteroidota bacterium]|nr:hypothetical protein [Bacteroidota bacterium]